MPDRTTGQGPSAASGRAPVGRHVPPAERAAKGRARRSDTPRSGHGAWAPVAGRPDPIALLEAQAAERVPELVPIRYGRMSMSPFSFYRGAAYVMASDLAATPRTGLRVQLCGDAHLANFGGFASPERQLLFDLVDFDETLPGPWEWDLKRLATSVAVAGRDNGFSARRCTAIVRDLSREYRDAMRRFAGMSALEVWYARASVGDVRELVRSAATARQARRFDETVAKGSRKGHSRAFARFAVIDDGAPRIRADPPLVVPIADLVDGPAAVRLERAARALVDSYLASLAHDRRRLLERYRYADLARKVVGVGSVGTRTWMILLVGQDSGDVLFLQAKEAPRSALERFAGRSGYANQGQRVVEGQRLMQAASDIFLGWLREPAGIEDLNVRDFYVRQLWDSKTSPDLVTMRSSDMALYARLCAFTLARAHARSGDAATIAGYLGSSDVFDRALASFAECYADQNERDYAALLHAIASGRIPAERDL